MLGLQFLEAVFSSSKPLPDISDTLYSGLLPSSGRPVKVPSWIFISYSRMRIKSIRLYIGFVLFYVAPGTSLRHTSACAGDSPPVVVFGRPSEVSFCYFLHGECVFMRLDRIWWHCKVNQRHPLMVYITSGCIQSFKGELTVD